VVSLLGRKLVRELRGMKGQALAIIALVGSGVAVYVTTVATHRSLELSRVRYYEEQRFAEVFAPLRRAPETVVAEIASLPGVEDAEGRAVTDVNLTVPGFDEPVSARVVSLAEDGPRLNKLTIARGRLPEPLAEEEVLVSDGFAKAHKLQLGARLEAVINGRRRELQVVGVALSPEYIFPIRPGDMMPDDRHYAILWMGVRGLAAALRMAGAVNDVVVRLTHEVPAAEVRTRIDAVLAAHGGVKSFGREDHDSHRFLSDEIRQLKNQAAVLPPIFFGVAAFLLSVVLSRLVALQRTEIGTLKAMGYSNAAIGLHYTQLAGVLLVGGAAAGTLLGSWLGSELTQLYAVFYRLPVLDFHLPPEVVVQAVLLCALLTGLGVAGSVSRAVRLAPAVAMRPEPPAVYRPTRVERLRLFQRLGPAWRMVVRHMLRRARRTVFAAIGVGAALAIVLSSLYFNDAIDWLVKLQFQVAQREDVTVTFVEPLPREVLHELARLPGVRQVEGFRAVPVVLRAGPRMRRLGLLGLPGDSQLRQVLSLEHAVPLPSGGLTMSAVLASSLGVRPGDRLTVEIQEGQRRTLRLPVVSLVEDWAGVMAVMEEEALARALGEPAELSGAMLLVDAAAEKRLYRELREQPRVAGVTLKHAAVEMFRETSAQYVLVFAIVLVWFALVITAGVLYNSGRISFAERQRELATLRVLGMTRGEAWLVLAGELGLQLALAIPAGLLMGAGFVWLSARMMESELFRIPVIFVSSTFTWGALLVMAGGLLVILLVRRWVSSLDLVGVLKTRE
jgi:putative ABC transport system permease protein